MTEWPGSGSGPVDPQQDTCVSLGPEEVLVMLGTTDPWEWMNDWRVLRRNIRSFWCSFIRLTSVLLEQQLSWMDGSELGPSCHINKSCGSWIINILGHNYEIKSWHNKLKLTLYDCWHMWLVIIYLHRNCSFLTQSWTKTTRAGSYDRSTFRTTTRPVLS